MFIYPLRCNPLFSKHPNHLNFLYHPSDSSGEWEKSKLRMSWCHADYERAMRRWIPESMVRVLKFEFCAVWKTIQVSRDRLPVVKPPQLEWEATLQWAKLGAVQASMDASQEGVEQPLLRHRLLRAPSKGQLTITAQESQRITRAFKDSETDRQWSNCAWNATKLGGSKL